MDEQLHFQIPEIQISDDKLLDLSSKKEYKIDDFSSFYNEIYQFNYEGKLIIQLVENQIYIKNINCELHEIQLYLDGIVLAAYFYRENILCLHASAFLLNSKGVLIVGDSEVGKSTTCMQFVLQGAAFIADDIVPLYGKDYIYTKAFVSKIKLWDDAINYLELNEDKSTKIVAAEEKYVFNVKANKEELHINSIFILENNFTNELNLTKINGIDKIELLGNYIFKPEFLDYFNKNKQNYLDILTKLAQQTEVFKITKPILVDHKKLKQLIENELK